MRKDSAPSRRRTCCSSNVIARPSNSLLTRWSSNHRLSHVTWSATGSLLIACSKKEDGTKSRYLVLLQPVVHARTYHMDFPLTIRTLGALAHPLLNMQIVSTVLGSAWKKSKKFATLSLSFVLYFPTLRLLSNRFLFIHHVELLWSLRER